jgi:hypothetical protein
MGNKDFRFVASETEFEKLNSDEVANYNRIIIFAELLWQDRKYTDFYGIDIAVLLRLKLKALSPICILSFLPKDYFEKFGEIKYNILKARGTCFQRLPTTFSEIEKALSTVIPISAAMLAFLPLYLVEIKNLIGDIKHNLRISSTKIDVEQTLARINQFSEMSIFSSLQVLADKIKTAHDNQNIEEFEDAIDKLVEKLNGLQNKDSSSRNDKKEKIILLEDKKEELEWAKIELERYFDVYAFQDANEAVKEIDADEKNDYRALICDWELLKPNSNEHQDRLGFEVLEYASKKRFYALFSLTISDTYSVSDVNSLLTFEHQVFKKAFEEGKSRALWDSYLPIIKQKVEQTTELICSIPDCSNWITTTRRNQTLPSYKTQYIEKRNSAGWSIFEHNISERVNSFFDISGGNDETLLEIRADIESLLITRRIFYKFFMTKYLERRSSYDSGVKDSIILGIMKKEFGRSTDADSSRNKFLSDLCLKFSGLPAVGMLPEEKAWLASHGLYV